MLKYRFNIRHADDATKFDCNWDDCHKKDFASKTRVNIYILTYIDQFRHVKVRCNDAVLMFT